MRFRAACPRRPSPTRSSQARCVTGAARPAMPPSRPLNSMPGCSRSSTPASRSSRSPRPPSRTRRWSGSAGPSFRTPLSPSSRSTRRRRPSRSCTARSCCSRASCRGATRPMGRAATETARPAPRSSRASPPNCAARWSTCASTRRWTSAACSSAETSFDLRSLTGPLVNELALDVETLDVGEDLDLSKLPEPSDSFRSRLGAWRTALALAADPSPRPGLSREHARPASSLSALVPRIAAAAVAGALIVAAGWGALGYLTAGVTARQERMRRTIGVLEPELQRQDEERRRAAVGAAREAALGAFASQGPRLARIHGGLRRGDARRCRDLLDSRGAGRGVLAARGGGPGGGARRRGRARDVQSVPQRARRVADHWPPVRAAVVARADIGSRRRHRTVAGRGSARRRAARPAQPLATPRPSATGPSYIEVARDGRLYRIPLRRNTGNLEASRRTDEARRRQEAALARQAAATSPASSGDAAPGAPGRHPASVVAFTLRYEVPK